MSENNKNIDSSDFKKYFSDKLSSDEKVDFENSIEEDSFESEALEGFQSLENNALVTASIGEVESKISKRTGITFGKTRSLPFLKPLGIAASVVLVFGSIIYTSTLFKNEEKFAENKKVNQVENITSEENTSITFNNVEDEINSELESIEFEENNIEDIDLLTNSNEKVEDKVAHIKKPALPKAPVDEVAEDDFFEISTLASNEKTSSTEAEEVVASVPSSIQSDNGIAAADYVTRSAEKKEVEIESNFQRGKQNYKNSNFSEAIGDFQKSSSENKNVIESEYYIAMSYYNLNRHNKAIRSFNNVIESNSSLRSNAMWYKSEVLLQQGKTSDSKKLLEELAKGKSSFKNQAIDKLKTLN